MSMTGLGESWAPFLFVVAGRDPDYSAAVPNGEGRCGRRQSLRAPGPQNGPGHPELQQTVSPLISDPRATSHKTERTVGRHRLRKTSGAHLRAARYERREMSMQRGRLLTAAFAGLLELLEHAQRAVAIQGAHHVPFPFFQAELDGESLLAELRKLFFFAFRPSLVQLACIHVDAQLRDGADALGRGVLKETGKAGHGGSRVGREYRRWGTVLQELCRARH